MVFSGYETLDNSPSDVLTTATYAIRQASVAVTMSGLEEIQNAGKEQMIGLMSSRINVAQATMKNNISDRDLLATAPHLLESRSTA